ncbi:MAG: hypothetical protein ACTSVU_04645 [Promethearchaeota archaeon]
MISKFKKKKIQNFEDLRIVDNFYQTSSFFPMPIIAISTISESGQTNIGPYSLCFPYYVAGKDYYAMILSTRANSNTSKNILRTKRCALNFISDKKKYLKEMVRLGFPGDNTAEKMKDCLFHLENGFLANEDPNGIYPQVVSEAFQVFECTWMSELDGAQDDKVQEEYNAPFHNFNGITSQMGAHFILRIDKILIKSKFKSSLINKVQKNNFPQVPVDYGYRDNTNFWMTKFIRPLSIKIQRNKKGNIGTIKYAADRIDPVIKFTDDACAKLMQVPRIFLNAALKGGVDWAKKNNITLITAEHMDIIRDKRAAEKKK